VAIEQKNPTKTSRSTVGTATEIYDYLRLLWARVGHTFCPKCGREMHPDTAQSVADTVMSLPEGTRFHVTFPLRLSSEVTHDVVMEDLRAQGFLRVGIDGIVHHLDDLATTKTDLTEVKDLLIVVDRLAIAPEIRSRLTDAISTAFAEGECDCVILFAEPVVSPFLRDGTRRTAATDPSARSSDAELVLRLNFTERYECPNDKTRAPAPTPQLFSFNSPRGACPTCNGFGAVLEYDEALIVPYPDRSLRDGAIDPWTKPRYDNKRRALAEFAKRERISLDAPWADLPKAQRARLLNERSRGYKGIIPFLKDLEETARFDCSSDASAASRAQSKARVSSDHRVAH
jgi:excinuclease ABC subunit A